MSFFFHKFLRAKEKGFSWLRKIKFVLQVFFHGGKIACDGNLRILHPIQFQGPGSIKIERDVTLGHPLGGSLNTPILIQPREKQSGIYIGKGSIINNGAEIISRSSIQIGEECIIGSRACIYDSDFHGIKVDQRKTPGITKPIRIGDNVWIGTNVMILKGTIIGKDAVIGAGCIVTKEIPPGSIVVGNPMKIIGSVYA